MRLQDLTQLLGGLLPLFSQRRLAPSPRRRSFEQGDWLAELELLQLAQELNHGWPRSQSNQWLMRMGLWEEDLPSEV